MLDPGTGADEGFVPAAPPVAHWTVPEHDEVQEHPENDVLPKAIHLLLDEENNLSQEEYMQVKEAIATVAAAASGGADKSMVSKLFTGMIGPVAVGAGIGLFTPLGIVGGIASTGWLKSMLDNGKDT